MVMISSYEPTEACWLSSMLSLYITLPTMIEIFFPKKFLKPRPGSCGSAVKKSEELPQFQKVRTPTGSVKDIHFPFPLQGCFNCVLRIIVLLKDKPLSQSEPFGKSSQGFFFYFYFSVMCSVHFSRHS